MTFVPRLIKPSRLKAKNPELKKSKVIKNHNRKVETSIVFDLNILSKINEVETGKTSYKASGLKDLASLLNSIPYLCPTPGFAINEADAEILPNLIESFDKFLLKRCPSYQDHPNATRNFENTKNKPSAYRDLPLREKYFNSISYLGILKIQHICRQEETIQPHEKFRKYLEYMASKADIIGAVEAEAAKYVFFDPTEIKDIKFKATCKSIKKNFKKGGDSFDKFLSRCFNSARDIMYYRTTASFSNEEIDGKVQDTWLITADEGLANLSNSIHFVPRTEGSDSKYTTLIRNNTQKSSAYWTFCDQLYFSTVNQRKLERIIQGEQKFLEKDYEDLLNCINELEHELKENY